MKIKLLILVFLNCSLQLFAQTQKVTNLKSFSICDVDVANNRKYNCKTEAGQIVFTKVEVVPNKSITLHFLNSNNVEKIEATWDSTKFGLNNTNDLFIYKFMGTDLNKNGGMNISLVMRMDYSVQYIVSYRNENGRLLEIKMFDK